MIRGWLEPLHLPEPLLGFIRELDGERILALFNLSKLTAEADLTQLGALQPMPDSGFSGELQAGSVRLPAHGAWFAAVESVGAADRVPVLAGVK